MCKVFFRPAPETVEELCKTGELTFRQVMNRFLCCACASDFKPITFSCPVCGLPSDTEDQKLCDECRNHELHFHKASAAGIYDGSLRQLIHDFKFNAKLQLVRPFGLLLLDIMKRTYKEKQPDLIVPVPLHIKKHRMRGFNQAYILARELSYLYDKHKNSQSLTIEKNLLVRSRWTDPQTGLEKDRRKLNISNAFRVTDPEKSAQKHILLIDDVYTTGATADESARVLMSSGRAARVDVLTLARTPK